ncbi:class I SAM-dependent methyltransferase [Methylocystis sp. JAN1]|uniref:class I SAM-dependent methyltransferase n=1 Tax=Methylocystis sp. JAN1 TaxID=3397211 RepID=UPI003FA3073D
MADRISILRQGLTTDSYALEIGPSFNPVLPKSEGWNVVTIDHEDKPGLVAKYSADPSVETSKIEEVDFVWRGGALTDAIPSHLHGAFDAVLASHVIEHTPDLVAFLKATEELIKPDGVVILAVPDKRVCFDFYRQLTLTGDALVAHRAKADRHDARTHFENGVYMAIKGQSAGWFRADTRPAILNAPIATAFDFMARAERPEYIDAHCWIFVPASFELVVLELAALGLLDLRVERTEISEATEFYAWLRRGRVEYQPEQVQEMRRLLLDRLIIELAEQSRQIEGSPLAIAEERIRTLEAQLAREGGGLPG